MSLKLSLISKIIGGLLATSTASYGGWMAYDINNPTFHRFITEQGWTWSPIDGNMGTGESFDKSHGDAVAKVAGDWRCTKQLFLNINPPSTDTSGKDKGDDNEGHETPSKPSITTSSEDDNSIGCLIADLGHASGNKRSGFIKWELALKSGNRGFVYTGFVSFNTVKGTDSGGESKRAGIASASLAFEISREASDKEWKVGKGFSWADLLINNQNNLGNGNDHIKVAFPNDEYKWEPANEACKANECTSSNDWIYKRWVGFWEYKGNGDKQPTDALFIGRATRSNEKNWTDKKYLHDVWQTEDFDFKTSNQLDNSSTSWGTSIIEWYDDSDNKWKDAKAGKGDNGYLEEIYKPWAKKKGTWMEAEGLCHKSNSRTMKTTDEEAKRLLKFCYIKK